MENQWSNSDADRAIAEYGKRGCSADMALRVYTTRLLGQVPELVLHGGGNTSVKTSATDLLGQDIEVLCVKGSGWDMGTIEPDGLPAVRLEPLQKARMLEALSDEDMVNFQRGNLINAAAPNPSVETLLHAFLPHKFVDHTHAAAVLSLTDQPDGMALAEEVYDGRMGLVPYVMPGFQLAKEAADVFDRNRQVEGLILHKHGIFTFGGDAREAYERMIEMVSLAEARLSAGRRKVFAARELPSDLATPADIAPIIRGASALQGDGQAEEPRRFIATFRSNPAILNYVNGAELADYSQRGVVTPDHILWTKNRPLLVPAPQAGELCAFTDAVHSGVADFAARYDEYFERENAQSASPKTRLDPIPRVVLVPGLGLFGLGASAKAANIAADIAENTIKVITDAEALGTFEPLGERELFKLEYWSLEQAKLAKAVERPLARQVAIITGGAGVIGRAIGTALKAEGAEVALLDLDAEAVHKAADGLGVVGFECDVTDRASISHAFDEIVERFGGIDIAVSNAGAAWQGKIGEVSDDILRQSFELNFFAHQSIAQAAVRVMTAQGTGGVLLFNVSKQAVNPGADFGPYGLPKAATFALVRQYALDYGTDGIRSNGVNADRIRSGLLTDDFIAERARARGVSEDNYMQGNLLGREVSAEDVAQAFVALARARKTTGHVETVDGGNIAAALR